MTPGEIEFVERLAVQGDFTECLARICGTLDQDEEPVTCLVAAIDISYLPVATGRRPP